MIYLLRQGFSFKGLRSDLQKWNLNTNTNLNKLEEQKCVHDNSSEHKHDTKRTKSLICLARNDDKRPVNLTCTALASLI